MTIMRAWMEALVSAKGSDLHLKVGSPPRMRVDGRLVVLDGPVLTPEAALADAVNELVADPARAAAMGAAGRERVTLEFGWDTAARQTLAIYEALRSPR